MSAVGAVAVDNFGKLAAATSTGGMTGKPLVHWRYTDNRCRDLVR